MNMFKSRLEKSYALHAVRFSILNFVIFVGADWCLCQLVDIYLSRDYRR